MSKAVVPMESNPEVFTHVAHKLGLTESHGFVDIYSVDDEDLLGMVPRPVSAVVLLFPLTQMGQADSAGDIGSNDDKAVWFKQTIKNACGLYAVLHALGNNRELLQPQSPLTDFLSDHAVQRFDDDGTDEFVTEVSRRYVETFTMGSTDYPRDVDPQEIEVNLHFITFVVSKGHVFQLDGRLAGPVDLGEVDPMATDVLDQPLVKQRIHELMKNASGSTDSLNFSMLGLTETWN